MSEAIRLHNIPPCPCCATKTVTFLAGTTGKQGTVTTLFTVTGEVEIITMIPFCTISLTQSAGTPKLALGSLTNTDLFVNSTTATLIDAGNFWHWANPGSPGVLLPADRLRGVVLSENIVCEVGGTNNIDAGVIRFDVRWQPISDDGDLVAA